MLNLKRIKSELLLVFVSIFLSANNSGFSLEAQDEPSYTYNLAICAIFRDEARFLKEWIEFHRIVGVEHFYLYNNLSEDDYAAVLQPYIEKGVVDLCDWSFESCGQDDWDSIQLKAYDHCLIKVRGNVKWLAVIDTDEFLFPVKESSLLPVLERFSEYGGLTANWVLFGTSGIQRIPDSSLMIETLKMTGRCLEKGYRTHMKSIVRPERVEQFKTVHCGQYFPPYFNVDEAGRRVWSSRSNRRMPMNDIRINHYWARDREFFQKNKIDRRVKWGGDKTKTIEAEKLLNEVEDKNILRFAAPLRKAVFGKDG